MSNPFSLVQKSQSNNTLLSSLGFNQTAQVIPENHPPTNLEQPNEKLQWAAGVEASAQQDSQFKVAGQSNLNDSLFLL